MTCRPEPFFLEGGAGRLFATYFPPAGGFRGHVLFLPSFGEEMNRCRSAVADQARRFSELGLGTLLLDYFGTGDSEGDFSQVSWDGWLDDASRAAAWLEARQPGPVALWGFRLGALLALDMAARAPRQYPRLLLWQPVSDGKMFLTQYLRLRVAYLMDRGMPAETTESMRQALQAGQDVEVAGYRVSGRIASDLDQRRLADLAGLQGQEIAWFEHVAEAGRPLPPASQKAVELLRSRGCAVQVHIFTGAPIWQLHDRDVAPQLADLTTVYAREMT